MEEGDAGYGRGTIRFPFFRKIQNVRFATSIITRFFPLPIYQHLNPLSSTSIDAMEAEPSNIKADKLAYKKRLAEAVEWL